MKPICSPINKNVLIGVVKNAVRTLRFRIEQADLWMEHRVEEIITLWEKEQDELN